MLLVGVAPSPLLSEKSTTNTLIVERLLSPPSSTLKHAKILFATEYFESAGTELGSDNALDKKARHGFGSFIVDEDGERDYRAKSRHRVRCERLLVGIECCGTRGETARRGVLDDGAARFVLERIGREQRALEVQEVVERQLFAALLFQCGNTVLPALDVKCRPLPRIFAVAQGTLFQERDADPIGKYLGALAAKPISDGGIIGCRPREDFFCKQTPKVEIVVLRFERSKDAGVIGRIHHHRNRRKVFCRRPK